MSPEFWKKPTKQYGVPGFAAECRFPLPMAFRSKGFDPSKVDGVAVRITADQGAPLTFAGKVTVKAVEIVRGPDKLLAARDDVARTLANHFPPPRAGGRSATKVPIGEFLKNIGVNYPWPLDDRWEGIYPVIGPKVYASDGRTGSLSMRQQAIRADFRFLAAHRVSLVRVWLFGDLRRGVTRDKTGRFVLDKQCLGDLHVLLTEAEKAGIQLVPVLLDFLVADGNDRERLAKVGEEADIIVRPAARKQFLDCIEPVLIQLCKSPAVRMIDLWNEPGHMVAPMDDVVATTAAIGDRIRSLPGNKPVTVGVRNSVELPFWMRAKIDVPTFHWFAKMEAGAYPKAWAPEGVDRGRTFVTEIEATKGVAATLTALRDGGFCGGLIWSMNGNDGISPFGRKQAKEFLQWVKAHEENR